MKKVNDSKVIEIFTAYITRNGRRIYASNYGLKAFRLLIPVEKYKQR